MNDLTPEQQDSIVEFLEAYRMVKKAGKVIAAVFVGLLGLIVLMSQAWDAIKAKFGG